MNHTKRTLAAIAMSAIAIVTTLASITDSASAASGDCASGYACVWASAGYVGNRKGYQSAGYNTIPLSTIGSYYNHRSKRVYLHEAADGSERHLCVNPGTKVSPTSGWLIHAEAVYVSSTTNC